MVEIQGQTNNGEQECTEPPPTRILVVVDVGVSIDDKGYEQIDCKANHDDCDDVQMSQLVAEQIV
jgi:hypothetical protein